MNEMAPIARAKTLKEQAYEVLKGMILTGRLEHGRLHNEKRWAEALGVSRTPVREALLELSREGMVVFFPGKGFKVREFTASDIRDVFEVRRIIEGHVIEVVAGKLTPADLLRLEKIVSRLDRLAAKADRVGFIEADKEFHLYLASKTGNLQIRDILVNLRDQIHLLGIQAIKQDARMGQVLHEHRRILSALKAGDADNARRELLQHLENTEEILASNASGEAHKGGQ
jgi:DNA-binding GntR family transcriptional regulator